jgi:hypothetical protein
MIAHDPLHRSGRAELPHPAPTLGNNAQAHKRIRMTHTGRRKPPRDQAAHTVPRQMVTLTATAQDRPPEETNRVAEGAQRRAVHGYPVITEVSHEDRTQIGPLFRSGRVHASPQLFFQSPKLRLPPLPHRLPQHREMPLPGFAATMRKAQEVECLRWAVTTVSSILLRIAAKLDDSRFVGMQLKSETRESLAQFSQKPLCFLPMLKSCHEVIGETGEDYLPARLLLPPSLDPEVENIVEVDVGQQRADHAPYTKGNFQFERIITGWRTRYPLLDLRLKR